MAVLTDSTEEEGENVRLSTPSTVLDAFGEFIAAIRDYTDSVRVGETPSEDVQRKMERAFDQITALSAHLYYLRAINRESVRTREEERKRVAREIHDGPAQTVAALVRKIETCQRHAESGSAEELREAHGEAKVELQGAVAELRRIMSGLRPTELDNLPFSGAVESVVGRILQGTAIKADVQIDSQLGLGKDDETILFRIIQESVRNAAKHSSSSKIVVKSFKNKVLGQVDEIEVTIDDDGAGLSAEISTDDLIKEKKFGLISMRERAEVLGGRLSFGRSELGGLRVRLLIRRKIEGK